MIREEDDEAAGVILLTKDYLYFFYGAFHYDLGFGDGVGSRYGFLGGEETKEGVDGEVGDNGYA